MDSHTYGSMVNHGGYARGGLVGEQGPEIVWGHVGGCVLPSGAANWFTVQLEPPGDPDDGTAGVPAKV